MSVYKRGKHWCYHLHVMVNGTSQQHKRSGFATKAEALRAERAKLSQVDGGVRLGASRMTVADYLATWLDRYARSGAVKATTATTAASYVNTHLAPRLGSLTLAGLRRLHVEQAAGDMLQSGLSPKTVRNVIGTLHKALKDAVRLDLLPYNCASDVTLPKYVRREVEPYDASEVDTLLQHVDAHEGLLTAAWWLAVTCGLRRGELCGLRWCDVDLVRGELSVRITRLQDRTGVFTSTPKSRASVRTLALLPGAVDALARLRDRHDELRTQLGDWSHDHVLIDHDAAPVRPATLTRHWHRVTETAGLRRIRLHDARHTHGTVLADAGVPVHAISARLGHASVATTMHFYVHAGAEADRRAALTFDEVVRASGNNVVTTPCERRTATNTQQASDPATTPLGEHDEHADGGPGRDRTYDQGIMSPLL